MRTKGATNLTTEERDARKAVRKQALESKQGKPTPTQQRVLDAMKSAGQNATLAQILDWATQTGKPINKFHARGMLKEMEKRGYIKRNIAVTTYSTVTTDVEAPAADA